MNDQMRDRYAGILLFSLSAISWFVIIPYNIQNDELIKYGPDFFPKFITISIWILSSFLVLRTFVSNSYSRNESKTKKEEEEDSEKNNVWVGRSVFIIMIVYIILSSLIGFLYSTILSMSLFMWMLSVKKWYLYIIMIAIVIIVTYVFENLLFINLP